MSNERKKKAIKGAMMWIAASNIERVKTLSDLVNSLSDYEKALAIIKNPKQEVINALKLQFGVLDGAEVLAAIDKLLCIGNTQTVPSHTEPDCVEAIEVQAPVQSDNVTPIYLVDVPETAATGFKQVSLIEPAPMPELQDYDGTTSLDKALASLYGFEYDTKNKTLVSKITTLKSQAKRALGIVAQGKGSLSDADKVAIYQWHVSKADKSD